MASPAITPKKAERIAKKAAEAVLSHQGHVVIQANTPEMLPGLTGQKVVGLWPKLRADIEKRARNTDPKSHKTLIEQSMHPSCAMVVILGNLGKI